MDNGMPPLPFDDREEKLPTWARKQISELRRRTKAAEDAVFQAAEGEKLEESDTIFRPYADIPKGLGIGQTVRFKLHSAQSPQKFSSDYVDIRVLVGVKGEAIQLMGGRAVTLHPQSSNVINVRMAPHYL
jgi:hypothetical protein